MTQQPDIHAACILNQHEAWAALHMIREALEQHCPPGTVANSDRLEPTFAAEATALVRTIDELARSARLETRAERPTWPSARSRCRPRRTVANVKRPGDQAGAIR
jgi:hypothetical protein